MRRTPVTWILIALNLAVFLVTAVKSGYQFTAENMVHYGADIGLLTLTGEWWRLVSSMFLHFGLLHIGSNMVCLLVLGGIAERTLGSWVFLGAYLMAGVAGSIVSVTVHPVVVSAGASGAVFGTAGLLLPVLGGRSRSIPAAGPELARVARFSVFNLLYSIAPGVDATAHFGGFAAGIILGFALWTSPALAMSSRRLALTMSGALLIIIVGGGEARHLQRTFPDQPGTVSMIGDSIFFVPAPHAQSTETTAPDIHRLELRLSGSPDSASAYVDLAAAYGNAGNVQEAVAVLRRGVERLPGNLELLTALGSAELNTGDISGAVTAFGRVYDQDPQSPDVRFNLATALLDRAQGESGRAGAQDSLLADVQRILALPADTSAEMKSLRTAARGLLPNGH